MERSSVFAATPRSGTSHRGTQRPAHAAGLTTRLLDALQAVAIGVAAMPIKANRDRLPQRRSLRPSGFTASCPVLGCFSTARDPSRSVAVL